MIIKKFVEKDSRSAMAKIRDEFGADAVVLSSRAVGNSFEMIAAANYDEYDVLQQCEKQEQRAEKTSAEVVPLRANSENANLEKPPAVQTIEPTVADINAANEQGEAAKRSGNPVPEQTADGPTLRTLQTELADLKALIKKELPRYSKSRRKKPADHRATLRARLARLGLSAGMATDLLAKTDDSDEFKDSWQNLIKVLTGKISQTEESIIEEGGIAAFVGPSGSGKTSTVAKIAAAHLMAHGRGSVGLVTTGGMNDPTNSRLVKFARAMDIPCREAKTATHLKAALEEFSAMKLVLIDTPGVDSGDLRLNMQLAEFRLANHPIQSYLVVSAASGGKSLEKTINAFTRYRPVGLVVTNLDKSLSLGGVIETLIRKKVPLSFISGGTRIPGDLHIGGAKEIMRHALVKISGNQSDKRKISETGKTKRRRSTTVFKQQRAAG